MRGLGWWGGRGGWVGDFVAEVFKVEGVGEVEQHFAGFVEILEHFFVFGEVQVKQNLVIFILRVALHFRRS